MTLEQLLAILMTRNNKYYENSFKKGWDNGWDIWLRSSSELETSDLSKKFEDKSNINIIKIYERITTLIYQLGIISLHSVIIIHGSFFFGICAMISLSLYCSLPYLNKLYTRKMKQLEKTRKYNIRLIESKMQ